MFADNSNNMIFFMANFSSGFVNLHTFGEGSKYYNSFYFNRFGDFRFFWKGGDLQNKLQNYLFTAKHFFWAKTNFV